MLNKVLVETLVGCTAADNDVRNAATQQLESFADQKGFPEALMRVSVVVELDEIVRVTALVALKEQIEVHWSKPPASLPFHLSDDPSKSKDGMGDDLYDDDEEGDDDDDDLLNPSFREPEVDEQGKAVIREGLLALLEAPQRAIRTQAAHLIGKIGQYDLPKTWGDLFPTLFKRCNSDSPTTVHGAIICLDEIAENLINDADSMKTLVPQLFPTLARIGQLYRCEADKEAEVITRSAALRVISTIMENMMDSFSMSKKAKQTMGAILEPLMVQCIHFVAGLMDAHIQGDICYPVTEEAIMIARHFINIFYKQLRKDMEHFLDKCLLLLKMTIAPYTEQFLTSNTADEAMEGFLIATCGLVSYLTTAGKQHKKFRTPERIEQICRVLVPYVCITQALEDEYDGDIDCYIDGEALDCEVYSVRRNAIYVYKDLCKNEHLTDATLQVVDVVTKEALIANQNYEDDLMWRMSEAVFRIVLELNDPIMDLAKKGKVLVDLYGLITGPGVRILGGGNVSAYLMSTTMQLAASFVPSMDEGIGAQLVDQIVVLTAEKEANPVILCGSNWALQSLALGDDGKRVLTPCVGRIFEALVYKAQGMTMWAIENTLQLMQLLLKLDVNVTIQMEGILNPFLIAIFLKYGSERDINDILLDCFTVVLQIPGMGRQLAERISPTLTSIYANQEAWVGAHADCVEVHQKLVCELEGDVPAVLKGDGLRNLLSLVLQTEDVEVVQNACELLKWVVHFMPDFINQWTMPFQDVECSGVAMILRFVSRVLDGESDDKLATSAAMNVGMLISKLIKKCYPALEANASGLFAAMANHLSRTSHPATVQSLVVVFAEILNVNTDWTLELLANMRFEGGNGLEIVIRSWLNNQIYFAGVYERNTTIMALSKLLVMPNTPLAAIAVEVEAEPSKLNLRSTVKKTKTVTAEWAGYDVMFKQLEYLVPRESSLFGAGKDDGEEEAFGGDDDDDDEEEEDDYADFFSLMDEFFDDDCYGDSSRDDPDNTSHPLFKLDTKSHIMSLFVEAVKVNETAASYVKGLSKEDLELMERAQAEIDAKAHAAAQQLPAGASL